MDSLSHLFTATARRVLWQRSANTLGFFLPLGIAVFFLGYSLILACSLHVGFAFLPLVAVFGFLLKSLRQGKKSCQDESIARLLDEKTAGQERFLTLATLPIFLGLLGPGSEPSRPEGRLLRSRARPALPSRQADSVCVCRRSPEWPALLVFTIRQRCPGPKWPLTCCAGDRDPAPEYLKILPGSWSAHSLPLKNSKPEPNSSSSLRNSRIHL